MVDIEKPEFGYRVADDIDVDFYCYFNVSPIALLADCSFTNLANVGLEDGYDTCWYEDGIEGGCPKCKYNEPKHLWYDGNKTKLYEYFKQKAKDNDIEQKIKDLLIGEVQEWSRL